MIRRHPLLFTALCASLVTHAAACTGGAGANGSRPSGSASGMAPASAELDRLRAGSTILVMNRHDPSQYFPYKVTRVEGTTVHYRYDEQTEAAYDAEMIAIAGLRGRAKVGDDVLCKLSEGWRRCRVAAVEDDAKYRVLEESGRRDQTLTAQELAVPPEDRRAEHHKVLDKADKQRPSGSASP